MIKYEAVLYLDVGDRESVAQFRVTCAGANPAEAIATLLPALDDDGRGFTLDDLVQVVITREDHDVARNLLAHRPELTDRMPRDPHPGCGHEWHGADGGPCPDCGWNVSSPEQDVDPVAEPQGQAADAPVAPPGRADGDRPPGGA